MRAMKDQEVTPTTLATRKVFILRMPVRLDTARPKTLAESRLLIPAPRPVQRVAWRANRPLAESEKIQSRRSSLQVRCGVALANSSRHLLISSNATETAI